MVDLNNYKTTIDESVGLILTHRCNLNCCYCYVTNKHNIDMQFYQVVDILTPLLKKSAGTLQIMLMGGEPLLAFDLIVSLIDWLEGNTWSRPYFVFASTNGTLLNTQMKSWFKRHSSVIALGLSFDGIPLVQSSNRGCDKIDLDFFKTTWPLQRVQMTITSDSVDRMAEGVIYLLEKGFKVHPNVAYQEDEWPLEKINEYGNQLNKLIFYYFSHSNKPLIKQFIHDVNEYAHNIDCPSDWTGACGAGCGFSVYDSDGKRYPCHLLSPLVSDEDQLKSIRLFTKADFRNCLSDECKICPFVNSCSTCVGSNYIYRKNLSQRDKTHCLIMKLEVKAFVKMEFLRLSNKSTISPSDVVEIDSIKKLFDNNYLN